MQSSQRNTYSSTSVEDARRVAQRLMQKYDRYNRGTLQTNDMGTILRDIYGDAKINYQVSSNDEQSFFKILDSNKDSQITLADMENICIKYLCSGSNPVQTTSYTSSPSVVRQSYNPTQSISSYQVNQSSYQTSQQQYSSNQQQQRTVQYGKTSQGTSKLANMMAQRRGSYLMHEVEQKVTDKKKQVNVPNGHQTLNSKNIFQQGAQGMSSQKQQELVQKARLREAHEVRHRTGPKQQQIQQECRARRTNFVDPEFPPNNQSLSRTGEWFDGPIPSTDWIRPKDFFQKGFELFEDGILPGDIKQGQLGDCYFQCALAALAEWPERIQRLFTTQEANEEGVYSCWIVFNGVLQEVVVDDHLWYDRQSQSLVSMYSHGDEIWPQIAEKCWAKLNKDYCSIDGGFARDVLHDLTGAPVIHYRIAETTAWEKVKDILWEQLVNGEKQDFVMAGATYGENPDGDAVGDDEAKDGIFYSHAYSILAAYEINVQGRKTRLVKFRNPHGEGEYNGKFSDNDPIWNVVSPQDKKFMGVSNEDDGIFFMEYERLRSYYEDVQVCQYRDHYYYHGLRVETQLGEKEHFFQVNVPETGYYYFQVNQKARAEYGDESKYTYTKATVTVANQNGQVIRSCSGKQKNICSYLAQQQPQQIAPGTYYVLAKVLFDFHQSSQNIHSFGFGVYGKGKVDIQEVSDYQLPGGTAQALRNPSSQVHEILPSFVI